MDQSHLDQFSQNGRWRAILLAALLSLVINLQSLVELGRFGIDSPILLTNWDEFHYLVHSGNVVRNLPRESVYRNDQGFPVEGPPTAVIEPAAITDLIIGGFSSVAGLTPQWLGLLLDLFCPFFAFILYRRAFRLITKDPAVAESLAAIFLTLPLGVELMSLAHIDISSWGPGGMFVSTFPAAVDGFPIQRSVYTQLSLVGFAWALEKLLVVLSSDQPSTGDWRKLGLSSGILIYLYFFSWGAFASIGFFSVLFVSLIERRPIKFFKGAFRAAAAHLFIVAPAIPILLIYDTSVAADPVIGRYWFAPIEVAPLLVLAGYIMLRCRNDRTFLVPAALLTACLLSYPLLMNLQTMAGRGIAPYRFATLYLFPLGGLAALVLLLLYLSSGRSGGVSRRRLVRQAAVIMALPALVVSPGLALLQDSQFGWTRNWMPLTAFIRANLSDTDVTAVLSNFNPFKSGPEAGPAIRPFPNILAYLTAKPVLHQDWVVRYGVPHREDLERELLTGWIFSGKMQYLWPCMTEPVHIPGDLFSVTSAYREIRRAKLCRKNQDLISTFTVCAGLNKFRPTYVLLERGLQAELPEITAGFSTPAFSTPDSQITLYKFDLEQALAELCPE